MIGATGIAGLLAGCPGTDDGGTTDTEPTETDGTNTDTTETDSAAFQVSDLDPRDGEFSLAQPLTVSATVENTGEVAGSQVVAYRIDDEQVGTKTVSLDAGEGTTVSFQDVDIAGYEAAQHTHGIYSEDDAETGELEFTALEQPMPDLDIDYGVAYHPATGADTISVPDGWTIELVASEPLVEYPVDVKWDAQGRMWVVEMRDFMAYDPADWVEDDALDLWEHLPFDPDGPDRYYSTEHTDDLFDEDDPTWGDRDNLEGWAEEFSDHTPNGRISVLEDTDGDGKYEEATRFLDDLTLPRSFGFVGGADPEILVSQSTTQHSPGDDVFVARDTTGDLQADSRAGLIRNYTDEFDTEWNENGLDFMLDNWHWQMFADEKFRYVDGELEQAPIHRHGEWGITQDEWGRIAGGLLHSWLSLHRVPGNGDYLLRGGDNDTNGLAVPGTESELIGENVAYPIRPGYHTVRSYEGDYGMLRDNQTINQARGCAGVVAYRGDLFPEEMRNDYFAADVATNVVAQFRQSEAEAIEASLEQQWYDPPEPDFFQRFSETWDRFASEAPGGANAPDPGGFRGGAAVEKQEFVAAVDENFRPANLRCGPDGALYVVDMYANVVQSGWHVQEYITNYLGVHDAFDIPQGGRIYRIYPKDTKPKDIPDLTDLAIEELAGKLDDQNGWIRDTAKRLIVQDDRTEAADTAREIARESEFPQGRIHALWALHGIEAIDLETIQACLDHENVHVRVHAMQTGEQLLGTDDAEAYVNRLIELSGHDNERVVVQATYSLGEVTDDALRSQVEERLVTLLDENPGNEYVRDAVHSTPHYDV